MMMRAVNMFFNWTGCSVPFETGFCGERKVFVRRHHCEKWLTAVPFKKHLTADLGAEICLEIRMITNFRIVSQQSSNLAREQETSPPVYLQFVRSFSAFSLNICGLSGEVKKARPSSAIGRDLEISVFNMNRDEQRHCKVREIGSFPRHNSPQDWYQVNLNYWVDGEQCALTKVQEHAWNPALPRYQLLTQWPCKQLRCCMWWVGNIWRANSLLWLSK